MTNISKGTALITGASSGIDAALAGLAQGEMVAIPSLGHYDDWDKWEKSRQALGLKFGNAKPAERYIVK